MIVKRVSEIEPERRPDGRDISYISKYRLMDLDLNILMLISEIPEGCIEQKHYHSNSIEIFYCLTSAKVIVEGEEIQLETGDTLLLEPGDVHQIEADHRMKLLVIKIPNISDKVVVQKWGKTLP